MKAFDGQDIVDLYIKALAEQPGVTKDQIGYYIGNADYTNLASGTYAPAAGGFRFLMETDVLQRYPICQYVVVAADGEMKFKEKGQWSVHGFAFFDTFTEAIEYLRRGKLCEHCRRWFSAVDSEVDSDYCLECRMISLSNGQQTIRNIADEKF